MTICPIALAVGCRKCPAFSVCPATRVLGDQKAETPAPKAEPAAKKSTGKRKR